MSQEEHWEGLIVAIVGGDEREQEIARHAAATGAEVRAYGFPWPSPGIDNVTRALSVEDAVRNARIVLFPIPGIGEDGSIFSEQHIVPRDALLSLMAPDSHIILGKADEGLNRAASRIGVSLHEYEANQELMLLRAPAIIEGALKQIIENTKITIHKARICVVGQGNIGAVLTRTLACLGARVTVAARNPVQRASAYANGAESVTLDELAKTAQHVDMIISTVPVRVISKEVIDQLPASALVMDLAAPPGSVDLEYAKSMGRTAIWARALGRRAPVTVGSSQWVGISRIIRTILKGEQQ